MDSLNFLNLIYFIRDLLRSLLVLPKEETDLDEVGTSLELAIQYYGKDPQGLFNSIMSSDISLIGLNTQIRSLRAYNRVLLTASDSISRNHNLPNFIKVEDGYIPLREFISNDSSSSILGDLTSFFKHAHRFLTLYKGLNTTSVNHRLVGSLVSNIIHIKEVLEDIDYR